MPTMAADMCLIDSCEEIRRLGEEAKRLRDQPEPACRLCEPGRKCFWHRTRADHEREVAALAGTCEHESDHMWEPLNPGYTEKCTECGKVRDYEGGQDDGRDFTPPYEP
jgi:hypothetical protein